MVYNSEEARRFRRINSLLNNPIPEEELTLGIARDCGREEEMVTALEELKNGNGYRKSGKDLFDLLEEICTRRTDLIPFSRNPRVYSADDNFLAVENLQCVGADGNVFEQHDVLYVAKDIFRKSDGKQIYFTPYRAIVHCEKEDSFLPDLALTCNILAALYLNRDNPEVKPVLMQYKDKGNGFGWHVQNTVVDWGGERIVHYPHKSDFLSSGGKTRINQSQQRILLPFAKTQRRKVLWNQPLPDTPLEKGLKEPFVLHYVRQLTGLEDPSILVEIGKHFGRKAYLWVPNNVQNCKDIRAAWLGCNCDSLLIITNCNLGNYNAARGVKIPKGAR